MTKIIQTAGRDTLGTFAPAFAHYNDDILFGENWNDPALTHKTRCLLTVVALVSSGVTDSSLQYHLTNAKQGGVTRVEISGEDLSNEWLEPVSDGVYPDARPQ